MELEQLKQSWDKLSEKLDREEVLRKQELRMLAESKVKSYWSKVRMNQYLGWLVLICSIVILFAQGIQDDLFDWFCYRNGYHPLLSNVEDHQAVGQI